MAGTLTPTPYQTVLDADGVAVSGALIYTYTGGTTTAAATYTTADLSVANANPIVADSAGRYVAYLAAGANMKFVYKTSAGATIRTQDNVLSVPGSAVNLDIQGTVGVAVTAGQVCYLSSGAEATPLTPGLWYLTDADFAVSSTTCQSIGMAVSAIPINTAGTIRLAGLATTASAVVVGSTYYVSATAGGITTSAPALARVVGVADTTSTLILAATSAIAATLPNPIAQDLLFLDATYDIGKSGASRPRDLFQSRNATIGGTLGVTGATTLSSTVATGALTVTGAATVSTTLGVTGATTLSSTVATGALTVTGNETVSGTLAVTGATTLTGGLNTPLVVAQGGTGLATLTANNVLLGNGSSTPSFVAPSTTGNVLTSNGTTWASTAVAAATQQALGTAEGRLTLTTGTPVTTADVSAAVTAYYTPYIGNSIALFDGSSTWTKYTFTEITISLVGLTASKPYDIFAYNSGGTVTIETLVWTSATARATALAYQNGVLVKSGATTRRYLGTIYINSTGGQTDDAIRVRSVFNYYNRVTRPLRCQDTTNYWAYGTNTWRQARATATNEVSIMQGVSEDAIFCQLQCDFNSDGSGSNCSRPAIGIGEDSTTAPATGNIYGSNPNNYTSVAALLTSHFTTIPAVGYHRYVWLEYGDTEAGASYFIGTYDVAGGISTAGMSALWRA